MAAIEIDEVTKRYGGPSGLPGTGLFANDEPITAVENLDLSVEEGEVYGFLGPNGAGKSTTINMLLDFVRPTDGEIRVLGHDAHEESVAVRERTGVLPEGYDVYSRLTGREHVEFAMESKEVSGDPDAVLERVGIADAADRKAGGYSKGMAQRLVLGMALVGEPDLLVLDEPSTGLDPAGAKEMREIVRTEAERGATVFFSSHVLEQVEAVCDRVAILREGRLVAEDSIQGLRDAADTGTRLLVRVAGDPSDVSLDVVRDIDGVDSAEVRDDAVAVVCDSDSKTRVVTAIEDAGTTIEDFRTEESSLEDLFLHYTENPEEGAEVPA